MGFSSKSRIKELLPADIKEAPRTSKLEILLSDHQISVMSAGLQPKPSAVASLLAYTHHTHRGLEHYIDILQLFQMQ